jgi:hypothetical protein
MIGAGTFINPLLKIITVVAILGATYIFIIEPVLDTTQSISDDVNQSIGQSVQSTNNQIQQALDVAEQQTSESFSYQVSGPPKEVRKVLDCVQRANNDVDKIQRCID